MRRRMKHVVQTITIATEGNMWFATSEDEPTIFVSAHTREAMNAGLARALYPVRQQPKGSEP